MRPTILLLGLGLLAPLPARAQNPAKPEPEEPDFAFISGSAYTQVAKSVQLIYQNAYGTRAFSLPGGKRNADAFLFFFRTEYGITDRWELDIVTPGSGSRERLNGATLTSAYGFDDAILGIRYRFLSEGRRPITLTMGPQLILPTGSVARGTGKGSAGVAWDAAASKDFGGPVFLYSTFNYKALPSSGDTTPGSSQRFTLHELAGAMALGFRALERPRNGSKHDVHIYLEGGGDWGQEVEPGATTGMRRGKLSWVFSPGVRYGFLAQRKTLVEIGVAAPVGLGPNGPKRSLLIQFQFELVFRQPE